MTLLAAGPPSVTAAGEWKWQLRDKNGRWIQMGSEVSFSHQGKTITGVIIGSPGPGKATVRLANGSTVTVPTAGVSATGKGAAPAASAPAAPAARQAPAAAPAAPAAPRQVKAVSTDLTDEEVDRRIALADKKAAARSELRSKADAAARARKKKRKSRSSSSSGGGRSTGGGSEGAEAPDDRRLQGMHRTSRSIEGLLRIRARELGRKDPFGESEDDSESKKSGSKDGEKSSSEESSGGAGETGSKTTKKRKDTRKKLTQSQIDAVNIIFAAVLKHVKAGEYSTALGRLKNAKAILKDTSAPWLSKRIFFLTKGLKGVQGIQSSAFTAAGDSWEWQLRDREGQWIEMGAKVRWLARGMRRVGRIVGSPAAGKAVVEDDKTHKRITLPTSRLTSLQPRQQRVSATTKVKMLQSLSNTVPSVVRATEWIATVLDRASTASTLTAAGSWQWQLRDKKGQWIEMGSRVSWLMKGALHTGILIGSPKEGTARVRDDEDGTELNLPAASRLIALADIGSAVRYTPGGKNPKAVLAKVVGRPVDAKGREKKGRLTIRTLAGTEKEVAESTLEVLPLDATRAAVREYGGYSVKIDGVLPKTGYMAAQLKGSKQFTPEEFFGPDGEDLIMNFMRDNAKQFDDDPEVYLGLWYDKDEKGRPPKPKVVIDVSHNIQDRDTAILAGRYQNQKSIWDVVKQEEIDTGGTGGYAEEVVRPSDEEGVGDVGRGVATLGPAGDSGGEGPAVVDDRKWLQRPPPVGGLRVVEAKSSMTAHGPQAWEFINNGGGTLADPRHTKAGVMSVSMSEMADHFTEVLRAAQDGVPYSDRTNLQEMADAVHWYEMAHQTCVDLLNDFSHDPKNPSKSYVPDLTIEKVTGVMAAMSPRMAWDLNIVAARKILAAEADPEFRKIPIARAKGSAEKLLEATPELQDALSDAKDMTKAGNTSFAEDSLQILRGEGTPQEIMGGLKRRSFWNSMLDPSNTWDVCIDGWMVSGTRRAGITYLDGRELDKGALPWLDDGKGQIKMEDSGAGYVIIADAVRVAAARVGITPLQAQALYWVSVGGGAKNAEMWTDPPGVSYTTRQDALKREARLAEQLRPIEGSAAMIPEDDGEWMDEDDFDARSIASMADSFRAVDMFPDTAFLSIPSAWHRLQPHPDVGGPIEFCWENPAAWKTLAGDVDRNWFMEQLTTREVEPAP